MVGGATDSVFLMFYHPQLELKRGAVDEHRAEMVCVFTLSHFWASPLPPIL